jgi:hypothetical protein
MRRADDYLREAESVERLAQFVSLWPDKQMLLEVAGVLRQCAAQTAGRAHPSGDARGIAPAPQLNSSAG